VAARSEYIRVIIPPHVTAVLSDEAGDNPSHRDKHILLIAAREGWAGRRRPTTGDALWLKPRWADIKPSSVLACERAASLASRPKRLSAWPSSTAC